MEYFVCSSLLGGDEDIVRIPEKLFPWVNLIDIQMDLNSLIECCFMQTYQNIQEKAGR